MLSHDASWNRIYRSACYGVAKVVVLLDQWGSSVGSWVPRIVFNFNGHAPIPTVHCRAPCSLAWRSIFQIPTVTVLGTKLQPYEQCGKFGQPCKPCRPCHCQLACLRGKLRGGVQVSELRTLEQTSWHPRDGSTWSGTVPQIQHMLPQKAFF